MNIGSEDLCNYAGLFKIFNFSRIGAVVWRSLDCGQLVFRRNLVPCIFCSCRHTMSSCFDIEGRRLLVRASTKHSQRFLTESLYARKSDRRRQSDDMHGHLEVLEGTRQRT